MKTWLWLLLIICLVGCGGNNSNEVGGNYADIQISVDTVIVDSGNEILMAATNPYGHSIDTNFSKLYNWDSKSSVLEIVDLDEMKLSEKISIEKEGANGVGVSASTVKYLGNDKLAFIGWDDKITITDLRGNVKERINLNAPWIKEGFEEKGLISHMGFDEDGKKVYATYVNYKKIETDIVALDIDKQHREIFSLPEFAQRDNYRVSWFNEEGLPASMTFPSLDLVNWENQLLFNTKSSSKIYLYNPENDTLELHQYTSNLTANEKTGTYKNDVSSREEMMDVSTQMGEEVNFTKLIWDDKNKVFYRFVFYSLPQVGDEELRYRNFINILNDNFELIGEKEITDLGFSVPNPQFVKQGKIYMFLNLDDELAYVRLEVN